jgi:hypothetical protein
VVLFQFGVSAGRHSLAPDGIRMSPAIPPSSDARSLCEKPFFLEQQFLQVTAVSFPFTLRPEFAYRFPAIPKPNFAQSWIQHGTAYQL